MFRVEVCNPVARDRATTRCSASRFATQLRAIAREQGVPRQGLQPSCAQSRVTMVFRDKVCNPVASNPAWPWCSLARFATQSRAIPRDYGDPQQECAALHIVHNPLWTHCTLRSLHTHCTHCTQCTHGTHRTRCINFIRCCCNDSHNKLQWPPQAIFAFSQLLLSAYRCFSIDCTPLLFVSSVANLFWKGFVQNWSGCNWNAFFTLNSYWYLMLARNCISGWLGVFDSIGLTKALSIRFHRNLLWYNSNPIQTS